jgi:uncharacterized protein (TIGR00251 family)
MFSVRETKEGATFAVRVIPRAAKNALAGEHGGALKVRLTAPPVEGRANAALEEYLAERLGVRSAQVRVIAGHTSRQKTVVVVGLSAEEVAQRLSGSQ